MSLTLTQSPTHINHPWKALLGGFLMLTMASITAQSEDLLLEDAIENAPVSIQLYLFSMPTEELLELSREGFTRSEINQLQSTVHPERTLLPGEAPITLVPGENQIPLEAPIASRLRQLSVTESIVYLFVVTRDANALGAGAIHRRSFGASWTSDERILFLPSESRWLLPAGVEVYRIVDFRYASMAFYPVLAHELAVEIGGDTFEFNVYLEFPGDS